MLVLSLLAVIAGGVLFARASRRLHTGAWRAVDWWRQRRQNYGAGRLRATGDRPWGRHRVSRAGAGWRRPRVR